MSKSSVSVAVEYGVGSVWSCHSFGVITKIDKAYVHVTNSDGVDYQVDRALFEKEYHCADVVNDTQKISRTDLIGLVLRHTRVAMTVSFQKKVDAKVVAEALVDGQGDLTTRTWKSKITKLLKGKERVMIGQHYGSVDEHGRLRFEEDSVGYRVIDPRTLLWAVVEGTKYVVS